MSSIGVYDTPPGWERMGTLFRNWWAVLLRGLLAVLFGLVAILLPAAALLSFAILFAAFLLADGLFAIVQGVRAARRDERWWPFALEGVAGLVAGVLAFLWPAATVLALVWLVAVWAIVTGVAELVAARTVALGGGRVWLVITGVLSVLLGILMIAVPPAGGVALVFLVGAYALMSGAAMIAWSLQLLRLKRRLERGEPPVPAAGVTPTRT